VVYKVSDLDQAKAGYQGVFGVEPYFDEPFYVGFNIEGYELGLDPATSSTPPGPGGAVTYWRVEDIELGVGRFTETGAEVQAPVQDVDGGVKVVTLADPDGNLLGLIENPAFKLPA
jgi:predicted enzyme related to lactoylglutathione lyase